MLSPSTEAWDRGGKRRLYAHVLSLQEVVLVPQDGHAVEVYRRNAAGRWEVFEPEGGRLLLETGGVALDLDALYAGVEADLPGGPDPAGTPPANPIA